MSFAAQIEAADLCRERAPDDGPLLQQMLYACALALGLRKAQPFTFNWPTPAELAKHERHRQKNRKHKGGRGSPDARRRAAAMTRFRRKEKNAAYHKQWRQTESGLRSEDHQIERNHQHDMRAIKQARHIIESPSTLRLADLDRPTYKIQHAGTTTIETWPPRDYAAQFIRAAELAEELNETIAETRRLLLKPVSPRAEAKTPVSPI
jgi:hypothetical protein